MRFNTKLKALLTPIIVARKPILIGTLAGTGLYATKKLAKEYGDQKVNEKASEYDRMIAKGLRTGELSADDIGQYDEKTRINMYKISSQLLGDKESFMEKRAFIGTLLNGLFAYGVHQDVEDEKKKYRLKPPRPYSSGVNPPSTYGIDRSKGYR